MIDMSKFMRVAALAVFCLPLSGCGLAELGLTQAISAGQRAKQAKGAVDSEKEAKRKVEEAMERAATERAKAVREQTGVLAEVPGPATQPGLAAPAPDAAMKAAEEQSK